MTQTNPFDRAAAQHLLDVQAVQLRPEAPFTLTSGRQSPAYVDCRKILSFPDARKALMDMALTCLDQSIGWEQIDVLAGGETAGIPFAAFLAERTGKPLVYVRKKPKGFGRGGRIEGVLAEGARVVLIEDLATDGGSKIAFAKALRAAGARCNHSFVVFFYGVIQGTIEALAKEDLTLHWLTTWHDVLALARDQGSLEGTRLAAVERFLTAPEDWTAET